jgi:hypothetical protein
VPLAPPASGKEFMLKHGYIKRDFDVHKWAGSEFLEVPVRGNEGIPGEGNI